MKFFNMNRSWSVVLSLFMILLFISCRNETKDQVTFVFDKETIPIINTDSVTMLISDSGMVKYKVITKTWKMFDEASEPFWLFPDKLYLEQYDSLFNTVVTLRADTVWRYISDNLWKMRGNVFIRNFQNKTFESEEIFWDQQKQRIYSNKPVTIKSPNEATIIADDFESNQQMTQIKMKNVKAPELYLNEDEKTEDSAKQKKGE